MFFLRYIFPVIVLISSVFGGDFNYSIGWQMKGFGNYSTDINASYIIFHNSHIKSLWTYKDNTWHRSYLHAVGTDNSSIPTISGISKNEGFWLQADANGTLDLVPAGTLNVLPTFDMSLKRGWGMYGYGTSISSVTFNNPLVSIVWKYDNQTDKWSAYSPEDAIKSRLISLGIDSIENIKPNDGFWVYAKDNLQLNIITPDSPILADTAINYREGSFEDQTIGYVQVLSPGTGNIQSYTLTGEGSEHFEISSVGSIQVKDPESFDFNSYHMYSWKVQAHSTKGDSNIANIFVYLSPKPLKHITLSDARKYDFAGDVLSFNEDELLVGVYNADTSYTGAGKVYAFTQLSSDKVKEKQIFNNQGGTYNHFGSSIAAQGDILVVGVSGKKWSSHGGGGEGEVDVLKKDIYGNYKALSKIYPDEPKDGDSFGKLVALSNGHLIVTSETKIYLYKQYPSSGAFEFVEEITAPDSNSTGFGNYVAMDKDYFAISSNNKVYFYRFNADGTYSLKDTLETKETYTAKIVMDDPYLAVGTIGKKRVYLFKRDADNNITKIADIDAPLSYSGDNYTGFGSSGLALKGATLAIGAPSEADKMVMSGTTSTGATYIYHIDSNNTVNLETKLIDPFLEGGADFGSGIALSDRYIAIGAVREDSYSMGGTGGVYIYDLQPAKPKILNMPQRIIYEEGADDIELYHFDPSEPVTYEINGTFKDDFKIDFMSNNLQPTHKLIYDNEETQNNTYPLDIIIITDSGRSNTYHTTVIVTPMKFHGLEYKRVTSPYTGKVWLDRNIGATEVCNTNYYDMSGCYGDYFQWGRGIDGHEKSNSEITTTKFDNLNTTSDKFVTGSVDWTTVEVDNSGEIREKRWLKTDGSSVCPVGFRVPTLEELRAETVDSGDSFDNYSDALSNFLKLPPAGFRYDAEDGPMGLVGTFGSVWTSTPNTTSDGYSYTLNFGSYAGTDIRDRADGISVRCIEDKSIVDVNSSWDTVLADSSETYPIWHPWIATDSAGGLYMIYADGFFSDRKASVGRYNGSFFQVLGTTGISEGTAEDTAIKINSEDIPYIIYIDRGINYETVVKRFYNNSWENVGEGSVSNEGTDLASLAINHNDVPYVAYTSNSDNHKITVKKFYDNKWQTVGQSAFSNSYVEYLTLLFDSHDTPYVIFRDNGIKIMKFDGSSWSTYSDGNTTQTANTDVSYISATIDVNDIFYIAYKDNSDSKIYAIKNNIRDDSNWSRIGDGSVSDGYSTYTSITVDSQGNPYIGYRDGTAHSRATVKRFNGTSWSVVGNAGFSTSSITDIVLTIDNNDNLYAVYKDYVINSGRVEVKKNDLTK